MTEHSAEFTIGTLDMRRGLAAVTPHMNPDTEQPSTNRVRVELGAEVLLMATDGNTAGVYATDATHVRTFGLDYFDLSPADIVKILAVFKVGRDEDADYPESVTEWSVTEKLVTIRDVSGMFAGHELELPATPPADFPNVAYILAGRLGKMGAPLAAGRVVQVNGKAMSRFTATAKAVGGPLAIDTTTTPFLVSCSDVFLGAMMPARWTTDELDKVHDTHRRWTSTADRLAGAVRARYAGADTLSELLVAAVRAVGVRQTATVVGLAEWLSVDKATATDLLEQMHTAGLVGKARRGKGREVMFSPDEVDAALSTLAGGDHADDPGPAAPEPDAFSQEHVDHINAEFDAAEAAEGEPFSGPPESPFSDAPVPPAPFVDSQGNPWPTSPFGPS